MHLLLPVLFAVALVLATNGGTAAVEADPEASPSPSPLASAAGFDDPAAGIASAVDERPDIIVVMVDDLAYIPNDRLLKRLPNINRLWLEGGARFVEAYNEFPLCCPARANFHSGQHSLKNGIVVNDWKGFDSTETLATAIDAAGYHTIFSGKYLNAYPGSLSPPGWDHLMLTAGTRSRRANPAFWIDGERVRFKGRFFDDLVRERSVRWLRQAPTDVPVLEVVAPFAPHRISSDCTGFDLPCRLSPVVMPRDRGATECAGVGTFKPPSYRTTADFKAATFRVPPQWEDGWPLTASCESLLVVDRMVGQLVKAQQQRERPAYFVFLSDNGMAWGQHGHPLKHVPWASRMPVYVTGPEVEPGAEDAWISIIDIPVTLADIAGTTMPAADGVSLVSLLDGGSEGGRDEILEMMPAPPPDSADAYEGWAGDSRRGRWRYIRWDRGLTELYNVEKDPWGLDNRAKSKRAVVRRLDERLDELIEESRG